MAEVQVTNNIELRPLVAFSIGALVKIFKDTTNNWFVIRDATTNDIIEIAPGIEARFPSAWPP